jgi:hypothetical protein
MASNKRIWLPASPKKKRHKAPDDLKVALKKAADELIESTLKPKYIQPPPTDTAVPAPVRYSPIPETLAVQ